MRPDVAAPRRRRSLTTRLVITVVCLLGVLAVAIGGAAALGLRSYLTGELDDQLTELAERPPLIGNQGFNPGGGPGRRGNATPGMLTIVQTTAGQVGTIAGQGTDADTILSSDQVAPTLDAAGSEPTTVRVPGHGSYRVLEGSNREFTDYVVGLPTEDIGNAVTNLLVWEALLTATGLLVAGLVGQALVRRQLSPLREVAATAHRVAQTPMASGAVQPTERVAEPLIASGVEVGQVGAALNTLLDHVEDALRARHDSEQQVRQFVADASHELRTPLATVRGYSELARRNPTDADQAQTALEKVQQESARMSALVEDLLLLARLDQGRPLESEPVDLRTLAVEAVVDAQVISPDHHWHLDLGAEPTETDGDDTGEVGEAGDAEPGEVSGDPMRLHQVVSNLVTNAWRHTPPGTTVVVSVRPHSDGTGVRLEVVDDGPGIDPDLLPHVFERFTRGDKARTRGRGTASHGTGLGLSTVRAIVLAHGGTVTVSSTADGTRFVVDLPR